MGWDEEVVAVGVEAEDEAGNPVQVGFLDATYFVAIMATTTFHISTGW